ncbi:hypothetical protein QR680_010798 [Steinernema hermaphroditum]|uniref:Uncharacterized protein n=1 Tax=Steinernema hermaphroditum TaxID=289476 RepID=A0AA39ISV8_9BILA|nr:hypothetical protein QR680_010798 [Steinernema hermaphroditum]
MSSEQKTSPETTEPEEENPWEQNCWSPYAITHVANASDYPIWVSCETDFVEVQRNNDNLAEVFRERHTVENPIGFTKIESNKYLAFHPSIYRDPTCRVYITILVDIEGKPQLIASAYPIWPNYSVLVSHGTHELRRVKMGEIWVDIDGFRHGPKNFDFIYK